MKAPSETLFIVTFFSVSITGSISSSVAKSRDSSHSVWSNMISPFLSVRYEYSLHGITISDN